MVTAPLTERRHTGVQRTEAGGLAALRTGPLDGEPVLLVPGLTGSKEDFLPMLGPLGAAGFDVTAVDQRGQYESRAVDPERECTLEALAADLGRVLDECPRPPHLLGHSFGGLVARSAVIAAPDRVASLTLLSSGPAGIIGPRRVALRAMRAVYERRGIDAVWAALRAADGGAAAEPGRLEFLESRFYAGSDVGLRVMCDAVLHEVDRVGELAEALRVTGTPALVAHGEADDAWPPRIQGEMARRLGARYAQIAQAAHSPAIENPEATALTLRAFWHDVGASQAA
jgi:pimeloyl-ACP methyl ester carboxylesterase